MLQDEVADLLPVLSRFRWRQGFERLLLFGLRGLMGCAVAVIGLSLAAWLIGGSGSLIASCAWLAGLPLVAALGLAVLRWPSERQAALVADRRLLLDERLATAVELAARLRRGGQSRRFDRLQIRDAIAHASVTPGGWLVLDRRARRDVLGAVALAVLAAGSLLLPNLPRPSIVARDQIASSGDAPQVDILHRPLPLDAPVPPPAEVQPPQPQTRTSADLAASVQQAQAERGALDALSQALGQVSATQPAAEAIQQGDLSTAKQQLSNVGEEADQLSAAAKQQLSRALQQAANTTNQADRPLADRERQAAQALGSNNYADQRQALRNLADQVERSGARSVPADQLARDVGQLQQQQQQQESGGQSSGVQSSAASAAGQVPGPGADANANAGAAQQPGAAGGAQGATGPDGQQTGAGIGTGPGGDPLGSAPSRLDSAGQSVAVPLMLGSGAGVRPPDGTEDQTGSDPTAGARSVSEQVEAQRTGQVVPEQNLVPSEQRPVVRGYFQ
jgi:hypothetical protein